MSTAPQPSATAVPTDGATRLAQALVGRGIVTQEEVKQSLTNAGDSAPDALLVRLVKDGFLTVHQARRAKQELTVLLEQQIPGYQLLEKIGVGAMGTVYKARQLSMNRLVAVKILNSRVASNPQVLERLTREAHLAAKLSHNNIVQAIDVGRAGDLHYLVMELAQGTTIKDELEKGKVYKEKEAVEIVLQVAQALQHARRRGLIHRDVKPANILLTADGVAKLADLGMARETDDKALAQAERGMTIGTPYYMAPEQIYGREDIDGRADLYALGATLYHMVTGRPPFTGNKVDEVLQAHLEQELVPPDHINTRLSAGLGEVVEFMLAKKRSRRYATPDDVVTDLECLLNGEAPKMARQSVQSSALEGLTQGEAVEEEDAPRPAPADGVPALWFWCTCAALGLSVVVNFLLVVTR